MVPSPTSSPSAEQPRNAPPADAPRARVDRSIGSCARCTSHGHVVAAFDDRVYAGKVCPRCIVEGRASRAYGPDHDLMAPMVFVARALLGHEPFASMLRHADAQRDKGVVIDPREAVATRASSPARAVAELEIRKPNRHERRRAASSKGKGKRSKR